MFRFEPIFIENQYKIEHLTEKNADEMFELMQIVMPEYYLKNSYLLGDFFGIRHGKKLVAVTGERLRLHDFTEISAVATHPDFSGKKMAQVLVAHVVNKNLAAGKSAFLHVAVKNLRAVSIYENMGFEKKRIINWTKIRRIF
jgi:predicted GNAT family acetyltransferase